MKDDLVQDRDIRVLEAIGGAIKNRGQDGFVLSLAENLDMDGLKVDCIVPYDCPFKSYRERMEQNKVHLYELGIPYDPRRSVNGIYRPLLRFLKSHPYDIIHIHSSKTTMMAMMAVAAKKAGVKKIIVHAHSGGSGSSLKHSLLRRAGNLSMKKNVDVYCACSRAAAEWKFAGQNAENALIIRNGIETERFRYDISAGKSIRERMGIPQEAYVIGNVGSLTEVKNQSFILEILKAMDDDTYLLLVGEGEDRPALEHKVFEGNISGRVFFAGSVSNVRDYLSAMDVFVFTSLYEGFGTAALEAQASGLPVVASDRVPGDIEITDDVRFLPLEAGAEVWAKEIRNFRNSDRTDRSGRVREAGYDVRESMESIRKLYLDLALDAD